MKEKLAAIAKSFSKAILAFFTTIALGITFFMAYIMMAPDDWPKPFYLVYRIPTAVPASEAVAHAAEAEPVQASVPTEPPPAAEVEIRAGQGLMVETGTKIVNLAEPSGRRYIKVNIVLEYAPTDLEYYTMGEEEKTEYLTEFYAEIETKQPVINDLLITLLSSQTFESVYTAEGKETLRTQIIDFINTRLPEYRVIFVYFTEFVVQ
ncbi:MAG: flagellar basal body-associated FliL family protein [Anaerolineales bacterium]|jgi:flagellar FliL protein|nr:flagellar basal body-associated FliL family protein [Anaerolineales bacterium]